MTAAEELVRGWLEHSPFAVHLGIELVSLGDGEAELRLPFRPELATVVDVTDRDGKPVAKDLVTYRTFTSG